MISTVAQYFIISFCLVFLAGTLARGGHQETKQATEREVASAIKKVESEEVVVEEDNEKGAEVIHSVDEIQKKLDQFKSGKIED